MMQDLKGTLDRGDRATNANNSIHFYFKKRFINTGFDNKNESK